MKKSPVQKPKSSPRFKVQKSKASKLYWRDGRVQEWEPAIAYSIWLACRGVALRTAGDEWPVQPWEFSP